MSLTALIDGDPLVYACAFVGEVNTHYLHIEGEETPRASFPTKTEAHRWADDHKLSKEEYTIHTEVDIQPVEYVLSAVKKKLASIIENTGATSYRIFLTGGKQFRNEIYPEYKANRKQPRPYHYEAVRDYFKTVHNATIVEVFEADDALASSQNDNTIICTIDKDLLQVPGKHYNPDTGDLVEVSGYGTLTLHKDSLKGTGLKFFYAQMLMGDSVDNIKGVPRVGYSKAYKMLESTTTPEEGLAVVKEAYKKAFGDKAEEQLKLHKKLLWMNRKVEV